MSNLLSQLTNRKRINLFTFNATCPNCGNQLKASKNKFHCKVCDKKGDAKDYKKWLWELDQKKLSHLVDNGLDSKTSEWWMNRY